ncbi:acyl-CoA dehydrogenase [Rhodococcus sp. CX]|uniref:acyl-CoA dehydrogenase family protein n=1 Tax=Rhodococcus sp. CX TaxID=2789880 RepID=UPI0018CD3A70|nr:acyl-CoA dehydrogenase family protein [Rhodococcus sp. CX]MBH0122187.1 acyl-CoA dehydrogenase [Rhodococcus sp. CX]
MTETLAPRTTSSVWDDPIGRIHEFLVGDFTSSPLVQRARDLVPTLKERAARQAQQDRILPETIEDMQRAGFFQMLQPRSHGGYELSPIESFEVTSILAEGDPSVGWVLGVIGIHHFHLGFFDERAQADVWSTDHTTLVSSPYAPQTAKRVDGGYLLSGRWSFSSGSDYCEWALLGANVEGEPTPGPGPLGSHVLLLPRTDYEIVHNWDVSGLRATGSNDIVVENAFVPDHRSLTWNEVHDGTAPGLALNDGLLFKLPFFQVFSRATQAPTALGALKGMADALADFIRSKGRKGVDPAAALALAEAYSFISEAKGRLYANYGAVIAEATGGAAVSPERLEEFRFQSAYIPARAARYGTELYRVAGGTGIYNTRPFGRYLTDLMATQTHAINNFQARAMDWMGPLLDTTGSFVSKPDGVVPNAIRRS